MGKGPLKIDLRKLKREKRVQRLAVKAELTPVETVLLWQKFASVFLWRRDPATGDVQTLVGWQNTNGWLAVVSTIPAAHWTEAPPASKPLDPLSEEELLRDVAAGTSTAVAMLAELVKWYSRRDREAETVRIKGGIERGKRITEKAAEVDKKIAPLSHLTSGQVEQKLSAKGVLVTDRTVRRHRRKKPG